MLKFFFFFKYYNYNFFFLLKNRKNYFLFFLKKRRKVPYKNIKFFLKKNNLLNQIFWYFSFFFKSFNNLIIRLNKNNLLFLGKIEVKRKWSFLLGELFFNWRTKSFLYYFIFSSFFFNSQILWFFFFFLITKYNFFFNRIWLFQLFSRLKGQEDSILNLLQINGFCLKFYGKLSKFAGSKKQRIKFSLGNYSSNNQNLSRSVFKENISTKNGVIGCSIFITKI